MKNFLSLTALLVVTGICFQVKQPVKWSFTAKKIDAITYEVHLTAVLDAGRHIYSQTTPAGGPMPAKISL